MKNLKRDKHKRALVPVQKVHSPLDRSTARHRPDVVVIRTEKRSWLAVAITGFGAVILRYLRVVKEHGKTLRNLSR